jgi:plasmid stabilization system protein ParE
LSYRLRVSPRAAAQIRAGAQWWVKNRPKAPHAFEEEIARGFELARTLPSAGERVAHPDLERVHRIHLGRIHYYLYYHVSQDDESIDVLALWHTSRGTPPPL